MPVRPFYDPSFDPGASVAVTYWTSFVGTRSKLNQERMAMRLKNADPSYYQDQMDRIQKNINELMLLRARASNDAQAGLSRFLSSYTRGSLQLDKARIDLQAKELQALADLQVAKLQFVGGVLDLESEESRFAVALTTIPPEIIQNLSQQIDIAAGLGTPSANSTINDDTSAEQIIKDAVAAALAEAETTLSSPKGQVIAGAVAELYEAATRERGQGQGPQNRRNWSASQDYINQITGNRTAQEIQQDVVGQFTDDDFNEARRALANNFGIPISRPGAGGSGGSGGSGGTGGTGGTGGGGTDDDSLFNNVFRMFGDSAQETRAEFDRQLEEQRARLETLQRQKDAAQRDVESIYQSSTSNPFLQPVFFQSSPSNRRVRQQQDVVDAAARAAAEDPSGMDFSTRLQALSRAGGNPEDVDPDDLIVAPEEVQQLSESLRKDAGTKLYTYIADEIDDIREELREADPDNVAALRIRFIELSEIAAAVPKPIKEGNPMLFKQMQTAGEVFRSGTYEDMTAALRPSDPGTDEPVNPLLSNLRIAQQNDVHFAEIASDMIGLAEESGAGTEDAANRIYELVQFADLSEGLGGSLARSLVRVYDEAENPEVIRRAFNSAKTLADQMLVEMDFDESDDGIQVSSVRAPAPIGTSDVDDDELIDDLIANP